MRLTKEILPDYFTVASAHNSHYQNQTNTFDFVNRNSDTLVVTVGDSWTWGSDLDSSTRLYEVYGNLIAMQLQADFLNLAQPGSNNFFIAERVEELGNIVPQLEYKTIYLICTFTETGRSFNSHHDVYIDYVLWFQQNKLDNFLTFLNKECYNRIYSAAKQHHMILRIGTNFIDAVGFRADVLPWFRQLKINCPISTCVGHTGVNRLFEVKKFVQNQEDFKLWFNNLVDESMYVDKICRSAPLFNAHPLAPGHKIWANSILETIK